MDRFDQCGISGTQNYAKNIQTHSFLALQGHRILVGIAGIPASGKTTLAYLLIERINLAMTVFSLGILPESCLQWKQNETAMTLLQPTSDVHTIPLHDHLD